MADSIIRYVEGCGLPGSAEASIKVTVADPDRLGAPDLSGWVRLGDSPQDLRIWAALWAVKAGNLGGPAHLVYDSFTTDDGGSFHGPKWVYLT